MQVETVLLTFAAVFGGIYGLSSAFLDQVFKGHDDAHARRALKPVRNRTIA